MSLSVSLQCYWISPEIPFLLSLRTVPSTSYEFSGLACVLGGCHVDNHIK